MRKKRLNLLVTKEDYQKYESYFKRVRIISLILSVLLSIATIIIFFNFYQNKKDFDNLLKEKNIISTKITSENQDFPKLNALIDRYELLVKDMKDDANFSPYYSLLISSLSESTNSAGIKKFKIDKQRNTDFVINFQNFEELMSFFKLIESRKFLENFEYLSLKNFNLIVDSLLVQNYELVFSGKFKPKYENKFSSIP
ncbi:MAG: hypothetical protein ACPL1D_01400 [Microgenomates group bacterium]